jgi:hypothetical protein
MVASKFKNSHNKKKFFYIYLFQMDQPISKEKENLKRKRTSRLKPR